MFFNLDYDVTLGVSAKLFDRNLSALINVRRTEFRNANAQDFADEKTQRFVANVILAWFWAMGVSPADLELLLLSLGQHQTVEWLREEDEKMQTFALDSTNFPIPSYINVKLCYDTKSVLWGDTKEAALYTHQVSICDFVPFDIIID